MGSATSRGKRVAPACAAPGPADTSPTKAKRPFKPLRIQAMWRGAQPDSHSEGPDSDDSREEEEGDGGAAAKKPPMRSAIRARTYGLCHSGQEEEEEEEEEEEPRGSRDVNKRSRGASRPFKKQTAVSPGQLNVRQAACHPAH